MLFIIDRRKHVETRYYIILEGRKFFENVVKELC